jgi:hypothetical protein
MLRKRAATLCLALGMLAPVLVPLAAPVAAFASNCVNYTITLKSPTIFGYYVEYEVTYSVCSA